MKNILKIALLLVALSEYNHVKAQNVIMLKDRLYYTEFGFQQPQVSEIHQARIIDGFIYTIEAWYSEAWDSLNQNPINGMIWFYAKYDLSGNLLKRKKFPLSFGQNNFNFNTIHEYNTTLQIFKINNDLLCYIPGLAIGGENNDAYFFKFNTNLDSIRIIKKTILMVAYDYSNEPYRKVFKTADNNLLFIYIDSLTTRYAKVVLQKLDNNLNILWTKNIMRDSSWLFQYIRSISYYSKQEGIAFNEKNGEYYIAIPKFSSKDRNDPNNGISDINIYHINQNGNNLNVDSFNLVGPDIDIFGSQNISITHLVFVNNGYRITYYPYEGGNQYIPSQTIEIDTSLRTTKAIFNWKLSCSYFTPQYLSTGFIDCNNFPFPKFYNFNSTYSSATLNQHSIKPIPDSFYMYYGNRFQKVVGYQTTWIDENIDTSYLLLGRISLKDSGTFLTIIPLSNSFGVYNGTVYKDNNKNCAFDNTIDKTYKGRTVEVTKTNAPVPYKYYDFTGDDGKFEIYADTGNFSAKVYPASDLWSACPTVHNFSLNSANDTVTKNFFMQRLINCPKLSISISTDRLRACVPNTYFVNYCNRGTADAVGATVQVAFDSALVVNSASVAYTHVGNLYTFNVGTIKEDSCGQFTVSTTLSCGTTLSTTQCVTAHIFPDSLCIAPNPNWNNANVAVDGSCTGDSVRFRIRNIGTGNMTAPKKYYVVEDHVLRVAPQGFQLNSGQELIVKYDANGHTIRLVADQVDFFPYPSNPTAVVENCGGLNPGFVNSLPNDDAADFIAINCTQNVGSFDPNDKIGVPEGVNAEHLITKNTDIDYKIRFQNTGTDTAYDVYVLDTLSSKLNIATLQMGAASHTYRYEIYGEGQAVLKVVFPNINLVDSFHNEPLSHGFFTYRISQDTTNVDGDKILNHADIYFDANHPVRTNTTLHTITENFFRVISSVVDNKWKATTNVYPNPFNDKCTIEIKANKLLSGNYRFTLFDLKGQLIQEQFVQDKVELFAKDLPNNLYLFRIEKDGELVGAGKVVKE